MSFFIFLALVGVVITTNDMTGTLRRIASALEKLAKDK